MNLIGDNSEDNFTDINNGTLTGEENFDYIMKMLALRVFFYCIYILIFFVGIFGNVLVCYVVFRNKSMMTVTNLFIANLALSDILLCIFAVPFTPLYLLTFRIWVFGGVFCHLVPFAQGVSVYISAFTLMSIAIDRFFVIIYPFKPRMKIRVCLIIIVCVWMASTLLTLPYGIFMEITVYIDGNPYCEEVWPHEESRRAFGFSTSVLQFVIPFIIISFCYMRVCGKLSHRAKAMPGAKSARKEEQERERTQKTNRMLISMVIIFGISWLPLNCHNLILDFYIAAAHWRFSRAFFLLAHAVAMSSTCYNPFLYAWLNENFRKEFKQVLPCFRNNANIPAKHGNYLQNTRENRLIKNIVEMRQCNGNGKDSVEHDNDNSRTLSGAGTNCYCDGNERSSTLIPADGITNTSEININTNTVTQMPKTITESGNNSKNIKTFATSDGDSVVKYDNKGQDVEIVKYSSADKEEII